MTRVFRGAAIAIHVLTITPAPGAPSPVQAGPVRADTLRSAMERIVRETGGVAAGVAWIHGDSVADGWTIVVTSPSAPPISDSSLFRLASVTKTLTALGVAALAEDGGLTLDAPVADLAPDLQILNPWEERSPVLVADLLEHTAGFDNLAPGHFYDLTATPRELPQIMQELAPELVVRWPPGDRWSYSSAGYAAAGYLVESIVDEPLASWIGGRVLYRMGWRDGAMRYSPGSVGPPSTDGFDPPGHAVLAYPAGDGTASARDMLQLLRLFLGRGTVDGVQVLDSATVLRMERPTRGRIARLGIPWGTGSGLYSVVRGGHRFWGHGGDMPGYHNEFFYSPELGVGYAILTASMSKETRSRIRALLVDAMVPPADTADPPLVAIEGVAPGWYGIANPRNAVLAPLDRLLYSAKVDVVGASLVFRPLIGDTVVFDHVGGHQLRERGQPLATQAFAPAEAGLAPALMIDSFFLTPVTPLAAVSGLALVLLAVGCLAGGVPVFIVATLKFGTERSRQVRAGVAGIGISIVVTLMSALDIDLLGAGRMSLATMGVFVGPIALGASVCLAGYGAARAWRGLGRLERIGATLMMTGGLIALVLLVVAGYVGLRLWR